MKTRDIKLILSKPWINFILAIVLLWPFSLSAQEPVTLNPPDPGCIGSDAFVNLIWTSSIIGNPDYYILRKIQGEANFTEIGSTKDTYYTDQLIDSDKNYVYRIRAVRGTDVFFSEEESVSAQYCQSVLLPPQASCLADGPRISLSWSSVSGDLSKYEVYRDGVMIGETTNTTFGDGPNLEGTKTYDYFIKAIWQDGNSKNSDTASKEALACPPTLDVATSCLNASPGGPKVNLAWNSLLGVQEYQIYRKAQNETDFSLLKSGLTQTSYIDNLFESLSTYWQGGQISYRIKAIWSTTEKDSNPQQINIPRCSPFLTAESNCDEFSFRLSWTATLGATLYNIYRDNVFLYQNSGTTNTSYSDYLYSSICSGQVCTFSYRIEAIVAGYPNFPSDSVEKSIDCASIIPPSPAPVLDTPEVFCVAGDSQISLNWTPSNNINYYAIYRNGNNIANILETSLVDNGVESGYSYTYSVTAFGEGGTFTDSPNSQTITAVSCVQPSQSTLSLSQGCEIGKPYVNLSWTETSNTEAYEIWRGPSSSNPSLLITFNKTSPEFISRTWRDTNVSVSTTYYYKIVSKGPPGIPSSQSNVPGIITYSCLPTTPSVTVIPACSGNNPVVNLSWVTDGVNTTRYEIFRQDYFGGTNPIVTIPNVATKNWSDAAVSPQTSYVYKVEAVGYLNSQRSSQGWNPAITTYNCSASGPFNLSEPNTYCQGPYVKSELTWTQSLNATSYDLLENRLNSDNSIAQTIIFSGVSSPYTDRGLGNALNFDGDNFVDLGNPSIPLTGNLTIEFWAKPTDIAYDRQNPICKYYDNEFCLTMEPEGNLSYYHGNDSSYMSFYTDDIFTNNVWVHVVLTRDLATRTMRSYKNGVFVDSTTWSSTYDPVATADYDLRIGRGYVSDFRGIIDDVRLYNRVLSASEIQEHYGTVYNNESNLIGLWRFDEGSGQTVSDSSNYVNNGILGSTSGVDTDDPTWVRNGLQSQTKYSWQVKANGSGGITYSNTTSSNTMPFCQPTKPGLILNSFCNTGNNRPNVTLKWSYTTATVSYRIYRDGALAKTINQGDSEFSSRTWTNTNLTQNRSYNYYVQAIGPTGLTNRSDSISVIAPSCARPSQPQNLTAVFACGGTGNSYPRVNLSWNASTNATSYTIYRSPSSSPFPISTILTSYSDTAAIVSTNYSYYVIAYGPGGASTPSNSVPVTTGYCTPSTPSITSLTTTCESNSPVNNISWSDSTTFNTLSYEIYRNTNAAIPGIPIKTIASASPEFSSRTWKDTLSLSLSTTYYYWIKAKGPTGDSGYSSLKSVDTYSCITPPTPSLSSNLFCQDNLPYTTLSWTPSADAYSYNLYRTNPDSSTSIYSTRLSPLTDRGSFALNFDSTNDFVEIPNSATLNPPEITVEMWIKFNSFSTDAYPIAKDAWLISGYYIKYYQEGDFLYAEAFDGDGLRHDVGFWGIETGQENKWFHIAFTAGNGFIKSYINGVLEQSKSIGNIVANSHELLFGGWGDEDSTLNGAIDEVRIYNRALSAEEILKHYQGNVETGPDLQGAWHLDEGNGTNIADSSSKGNNGTMFNMDPATAWTQPTGQPINILPLEGEKNYTYRLKAFGADTSSEFSNPVDITTPSCLPVKPDLAITSQCDGTNSQLKLSWLADPNTQYWNIYKGREEEALKFITDTTQTSYIDDDVESEIEYKYYLAAVGKGVSTLSDIIVKTVPFCYLQPSKPIITTSAKCFGYSTRIVVDWGEDPTGKTISYNVYRKNTTLGEPGFTQIYSGLPFDTTQYNDVVEEANGYIYQIEAVGSGEGNTVSSDPGGETIAIECSKIPPFPPNLSLNFVYSVDHQVAVSIGWTDAGNEEEYKVFRRDQGETEFAQKELPFWKKILKFISVQISLAAYDSPLVTLDADILNYVDYTVTDGKSYEYQVMASNRNGDTLSNIILVDVPIARPGDFILSWSWIKEPTKIRLTWAEALTSEAGGLVTYQVQRDETSDFSSPAIICDNISLPQLLECDDMNSTFLERYYQVKATNNALEPTYSNWIEIDLPIPIWKEIAPR